MILASARDVFSHIRRMYVQLMYPSLSMHRGVLIFNIDVFYVQVYQCIHVLFGLFVSKRKCPNT